MLTCIVCPVKCYMDRRGHFRSNDDTLAKRAPLLLFGYVVSFVVTVGVFAFAILRFLHFIKITGFGRTAQAAPFPMTFVIPVLLSMFGIGIFRFHNKLRDFIVRLKSARSSGTALRTLNAARHNIRGLIPAPPGQFDKTLRVLARQGVNVKLLVGDEASSRVLAHTPNIEIRLTDSKTGFLIVDNATTISGPGTEFAEENNAHCYINKPDTPEALAELHRVIEAFDDAFALSAASTDGLTQPDTH